VSRVLLDTHAFLWFVFDDSRLSGKAAERIADRDTISLLSIGSLWEIAIKSQLGKLDLGMELAEFFRRFVEEREIERLEIRIADVVAYGRLPLLHRDPFDRLLVAQAQNLEVPIVTSDPRFAPYGVPVLW
jgi:PIN domain nuclease of toxin-antitoxin system